MDATHWLNALRVIHSMGFFRPIVVRPHSPMFIFLSLDLGRHSLFALTCQFMTKRTDLFNCIEQRGRGFIRTI